MIASHKKVLGPDAEINTVASIIREKGRSSYIGEDDYVSLVKGGIAIHFHLKHPGLDPQNIYRAVKRTQKIVRERFGHDLDRIDVSIYDSKEEMRQEGRSRSRYASWIAGIYDGQIRVIAERDDETPESLYVILTHEIIHLAVDELGKGSCLWWLDEGLAVFVSQELVEDYRELLERAVKQDRILPLEVLRQPLPGGTDAALRRLAYCQVMDVAAYLVETKGWDWVRDVVCQCGSREFAAVLGDLGLNEYLIEQGWKRWRRSRGA